MGPRGLLLATTTGLLTSSLAPVFEAGLRLVGGYLLEVGYLGADGFG